MANYIFQKEAQVYLVHSGLKYRIDIKEIEFSQSFQEKSYEVKTLHNQSGFEGSSINMANPAEFSFNTPLLKEKRHEVVLDRLLDYATFDLYISNGQDVFKLEKCVIQEGTFEINRSRPLRLGISGEASKLSKFSGTIPGTLYDVGTSTTTYIIPKLNTLTLGGTDISSQVTSLSVEIQNDISWNNYSTVQGAVSATNASTSMFPSSFTVGTRVLAGAITKYLQGTTDVSTGSPDLLTWNTNSALRLKALNSAGQGLDFNITNCSFTNRLQNSDIYLEEYSWRMTQRSSSLKGEGVVTYINTT